MRKYDKYSERERFWNAYLYWGVMVIFLILLAAVTAIAIIPLWSGR